MDYPIVIWFVGMPFGEQECRGNLRCRQLANAKKAQKDAFDVPLSIKSPI
jgi:hypothetical protein